MSSLYPVSSGRIALPPAASLTIHLQFLLSFTLVFHYRSLLHHISARRENAGAAARPEGIKLKQSGDRSNSVPNEISPASRDEINVARRRRLGFRFDKLKIMTRIKDQECTRAKKLLKARSMFYDIQREYLIPC